MNHQLPRNDAGFTLIELIAVLVLIGIVAAGVGGAVVYGAKGFVFVRENTAVAQKAQLAMRRMQLELTEMTAIDTGSGTTCIRYQVSHESPYWRAMGLNNNDLEIAVSDAADQTCPSGGSPGFTLTDQMGSVSFQYEDMNGALTNSPPGTGLSDLAAVHIQLSLSRTDNNPASVFTTRIVPRNNGQQNAP